MLETEPDILLEQPLPHGTAYYLALPPKKTKKQWFSGSVTDYDVVVRAQWKATLDGDHPRHFPVPELADPTLFDATQNATPDFTEDDQPFWAHE